MGHAERKPESLPIAVSHRGNREFRACCCCSLALDPMIFIQTWPVSLKISEIFLETKSELPTSSLSKVIIHTDRQTDRCHQNITTPLRGLSLVSKLCPIGAQTARVAWAYLGGGGRGVYFSYEVCYRPCVACVACIDLKGWKLGLTAMRIHVATVATSTSWRRSKKAI